MGRVLIEASGYSSKYFAYKYLYRDEFDANKGWKCKTWNCDGWQKPFKLGNKIVYICDKCGAMRVV